MNKLKYVPQTGTTVTKL